MIVFKINDYDDFVLIKIEKKSITDLLEEFMVFMNYFCDKYNSCSGYFSDEFNFTCGSSCFMLYEDNPNATYLGYKFDNNAKVINLMNVNINDEIYLYIDFDGGIYFNSEYHDIKEETELNEQFILDVFVKFAPYRNLILCNSLKDILYDKSVTKKVKI